MTIRDILNLADQLRESASTLLEHADLPATQKQMIAAAEQLDAYAELLFS